MRRNRREVSLVAATTSAGNAVVAAQVAATDSAVFQTTALCLSASFCFLVCITPSMVMLIGKPYWNEPPNKTYAILKSISNQTCNASCCRICRGYNAHWSGASQPWQMRKDDTLHVYGGDGHKFEAKRIFYINHSINFFLYCITGKRFRVALRRACWCCSSGRRCCCCCPPNSPQCDVWSTTGGGTGRRLLTTGGVGANGKWCYVDPKHQPIRPVGRRSCPATPTLDGGKTSFDVGRPRREPGTKRQIFGSCGDLLERRPAIGATSVGEGTLQHQLLWKLEHQDKKPKKKLPRPCDNEIEIGVEEAAEAQTIRDRLPQQRQSIV